jgi:hypothetical protein
VFQGGVYVLRGEAAVRLRLCRPLIEDGLSGTEVSLDLLRGRRGDGGSMPARTAATTRSSSRLSWAMARRAALAGFAFDSLIEIFASIVVIRQLQGVASAQRDERALGSMASPSSCWRRTSWFNRS